MSHSHFCNGLSFRDYMDFSLYDESVGYYGSGKAAIGREGDFYTSVSVGPLFGQLLALQLKEIWEKLGKPDDFQIVEQGGHDARLAKDLLEACDADDPEFGKSVSYTVCDRFPSTNHQKDPRLHYCRDLGDLAPGSAAVLLCNELLDAFPVHRIRYRSGKWKELWVVPANRELALQEREPSQRLASAIEQRIPSNQPFPESYTTEICLELKPWLTSAAATLGCGVLLAIDYGFVADDYYVPERTEGTLRCFRGHRADDDPFAAPGQMDMTAHVDWTAVEAGAQEAGLAAIGFADQGAYLTRLATPQLQASDGAQLDRKWIRQFQTLTHPGMMGRSFGVMAFSKGLDPQEWKGFPDALKRNSDAG